MKIYFIFLAHRCVIVLHQLKFFFLTEPVCGDKCELYIPKWIKLRCMWRARLNILRTLGLMFRPHSRFFHRNTTCVNIRWERGAKKRQCIFMRSVFFTLAATAGECERSQDSFRCLNTFIIQKMKMQIIISILFLSLSHTQTWCSRRRIPPEIWNEGRGSFALNRLVAVVCQTAE